MVAIKGDTGACDPGRKITINNVYLIILDYYRCSLRKGVKVKLAM